MEAEIPKPPKGDAPAQVPRDRGCVCRDCGTPTRCERGEIADHRFTCHRCLKRKR